MRRTAITMSCVAAVAALAGAASADVIVPLGGGWEAVLTGQNVSLTPLNPNTALTDGVVRVSKSAMFMDIDPFTGAPMPITITFRQIAPDAQTAPQILIDDEMVMNMTGQTWTGFRQIVGLSNNVSIDASSTAMSVGPQFTTNTIVAAGREMVSSGGSGVANNSMWMPGATGGLLLNINLAGQSSPVIFTLKELPVIPAPGAGALAAAGLAALARRRR